jgi:hypothetical protein
MSWLKANWEKLLTGAKGRLVRAAVSLAVGFLLEKYKNDPWFLAASPLLQMVSKWLRDKFPGKLEWLPV